MVQTLQRRPELVQELVQGREMSEPPIAGVLTTALTQIVAQCQDEATLLQQLRRFRNRQMVRIIWRDLSGRADLSEVVASVSELAEATIQQAMGWLYQRHSEQWGMPLDSAGRPQQLVVLGMGKLGARELNLSSDVDLIFAYPEEGETHGGRRGCSNHEFFVRLGQRLIQAIGKTTADGFVFRVDMRLRPFGESSPLAISFDAMESYYQSHGREWERYAMIKARPIAGDAEAGEVLMASLRPFVYRRYIDFGAFESLREMKLMISREVAQRRGDLNVKLGAGGIREIEFIGQAFQLIRGGREPALQLPRILTVLEVLRGFEMLPEFVVRELVSNYEFLRNCEHRLQAYADQQTHLIPEDAEGQARLAMSMGFSDWALFFKELTRRMSQVHQHFEQVFAAPQTESSAGGGSCWQQLWQGIMAPEAALTLLEEAKFSDPQALYERLERLREGRTVRQMGPTGRQRLENLMPLLLAAVADLAPPGETMKRILELIERVLRRSAYLALLVENPLALSQLVKLCHASSWIATTLQLNPQLLDELLDPRSLYAPPSEHDLHNDLHNRLSHVDADDQERLMDELRRFKQAQVLRIAATDIMNVLPLMHVSDHLTAVAEVALDATLDQSWRYMVQRHGLPEGMGVDGQQRFAVIGYGKLGGLELGYGSDLDLVFLHGVGIGTTQGDGDKIRPLAHETFYARLAQRMIHMMGSRTAHGILYEIDPRLRPSGASGPLVSPVHGFDEYQQRQAWTWEHQALVRARFVAGDATLGAQFSHIRHTILTRQRDREALRVEVVEMREKMRQGLDRGTVDQFDLKQGRGGIADIEFMVQYGVLGWAHLHPELTEYTDNIRLLERLSDCGVVSVDEAQHLADAYRDYRARAHHLTLLEQPALVDEQDVARCRPGVIRCWQRLMGND